jgi:hypothetical protein
MFKDAESFNQDLSGWKISLPHNDTNVDDMFSYSGMIDISKCPCFSDGKRACPGRFEAIEDSDCTT